VAPPPPASSAGSLEPDLVLLGSWTVSYVVGPANGNGANIVIPLRSLDRQVIKPGTTFDFWSAVGEVSRRTGYRRGGIIAGHWIDPDGALAGGICTVSTAVFNAAARVGLQVTARTSHSGYLAKYPLGLDAAVAKGDGLRQTMAFRNDTTAPIVIRTVSTPGIARVDLYGPMALGRTVSFSQPAVSGRVKAHDRHARTASLPRGQHRRVQARSDGMTVVVTRTVMAADGHTTRRDRWTSVYRWLGGLVLDGTD
jgi:vancomycin resistance protein YoaR